VHTLFVINHHFLQKTRICRKCVERKKLTLVKSFDIHEQKTLKTLSGLILNICSNTLKKIAVCK
jgi:hypothetical protein